MKRLLILACFALPAMACADSISHQTPPRIEAEQMATAQGKLQAARAYVEWFMAEDAEMRDPVAVRGPFAPTYPGQPLTDCRTRAVVSAYKIGNASFEGSEQKVAVVPVALELVILDVANEGGPTEKTVRQGGAGCTFEYERYNRSTKGFRKISGFRKHLLYEEFIDWGPYITLREKRRYMVAPAPEQSIVRFLFRVSVDKGVPYQLEPQFPRHFGAESVAAILTEITDTLKEGIRTETSDRDPAARGEALKKDLARMKRLARNNGWTLERIKERLEYLRTNRAFDEVQP